MLTKLFRRVVFLKIYVDNAFLGHRTFNFIFIKNSKKDIFLAKGIRFQLLLITSKLFFKITSDPSG